MVVYSRLRLKSSKYKIIKRWILFVYLGYIDWVYCHLTDMGSVHICREHTVTVPLAPVLCPSCGGCYKASQTCMYTFCPSYMYLLFIPHQKSNGCCNSDRHLSSYPIRLCVMLYYLTSCSVTMPYSFWHLNPLKSSANHPTELLLTLSVLLLMSMQSSFFCVNVSLKMNMLGLEPQTPRFRVECATFTPRVMFRDTQLSFQSRISGAAVSADIVC